MIAKSSEPGPIQFEAFIASNWKLKQQALVNLKHPRAVDAGLLPGDVSVHHLFYSLLHPSHGLFLIDTGVARALRQTGGARALSSIVRKALALDDMEILLDTATWLEQQKRPLAGVLLTHLHVDHLLGLEDLPVETPLYVGPEPRSRAHVHALSRSSTTRLLGRFGPLREVSFQRDPSGYFAGVVDLFGDDTVFAMHVPGHTAGSLAFFTRTERGPVLVTGDAASCTFGWKNVVPGAGLGTHHAGNAATSIEALSRFASEVSGIEIHLGHHRLLPA
jgi:glyoxylase-like metal-dependent hydrolase (beta-lactamase superfamily II)